MLIKRNMNTVIYGKSDKSSNHYIKNFDVKTSTSCRFFIWAFTMPKLMDQIVIVETMYRLYVAI